MPSTLAIRLSDADRRALEAAAEAAGQGVSTYVRRLAEAEAQRIRSARIRAETQRVVTAINASQQAQAELEALSPPQLDPEVWPAYEPLSPAMLEAAGVVAKSAKSPKQQR